MVSIQRDSDLFSISTIVQQFKHHSSSSLSCSFRYLSDRICNQSRCIRIHPIIGRKKHFCVGTGNQIGLWRISNWRRGFWWPEILSGSTHNMPTNVRKRCDNRQRNGTTASHQRWRNTTNQWIMLQSYQSIVKNAQKEFARSSRSKFAALVRAFQVFSRRRHAFLWRFVLGDADSLTTIQTFCSVSWSQIRLLRQLSTHGFLRSTPTMDAI
jgi:hypothetical protein